MQLKDAIEKFHNVKKFSQKKPDWRDIIECIDTSRYTSMAGDNFTLKFILIDEPKTIQKLVEYSQQPFIQDTQYVIVVCSKKKRTKTLYKERAEKYATQQAGAAIQNILLSLTEKKLSTYWIRHFVDKMIKTELKIPNDIDIEALLPIGYEFGKTKKKEKIDLNNVIYFKKWGNKRLKPLKTLDV